MDVIWFAEIKWDYLRTRKQQLIRRKPDDIDVLYLEPYVRGKDNLYDIRQSDGISVVTVPFLKSVPSGPVRAALDAGWVRSLVNRIATHKVTRHASRVGFGLPVTGFIISNVFAADVALSMTRRFVVYDCNDAHAAFPGLPDWTRTCFNRICRSADRIVASSNQLVEDVVAAGAERADICQIGNGVEFNLFAARRPSREQRRVGGHPRIGYLGAIAPWFDFDVVARLAAERPNWDIELVGPVMQGVDDKVARLTAMDNVSISGAVSHDDVPAIMSRFTVGLIPFQLTELTRGVNPNKMYEYLAAGVPVVATRFSQEVTRFPGVVWSADGPEEFIAACDEAVAAARGKEASHMIDRADEIARDHDWETIAREFWNEVRQQFRR